MKRRAAFALVVLSSPFLSSCGAMGVKLPNSPHEKVSFAFSGVEKSLKKGQKKKSILKQKKELLPEPTNDTIETIFDALPINNDGDTEIGYNDTPLIQFQYLKAVYDSIGDEFSFNTRYTHKLTGDIYYDFGIDEKAEGEENKHSYDFDFSILIDINEEDIITAEVGFDITFTHEDIQRRQYMYVEMILDYDMGKANPNFDFTMRDVTDCLSYPDEEERFMSVEYDYISVRENAIKEFRKFGVASKESIENYANDDFVSKYTTLRGIRNGENYKITDPFKKDPNLLRAVIEGCSLNTMVSTYKTSFFEKRGVDSPVIPDVVAEFNEIYGQDFVYHIATSGKDEEWTPRQDEGGRRLVYMNESHQFSDSLMLDTDNHLSEFFSRDLKLYLLNDRGDTIREVGLNELNITLKSDAYPRSEEIEVSNPNELFSVLIERSGFIYQSNTGMSAKVKLSLKDDSSVNNGEGYTLMVKDEGFISEKELGKNWPSKYLNAYLPFENAIPSPSSSAAYYEPSIDGESTNGPHGKIIIHDADPDEITQYTYQLTHTHGFRDNVDGNGVHTYSKKMNDDKAIQLGVTNGGKTNDSEISFDFVQDVTPDLSLADYISALFDTTGIEGAAFPNRDQYNVLPDYPSGNRIVIPGASQSEYVAYINSYTSKGFSIENIHEGIRAYKYEDGILYSITFSNYWDGVTVYKTPLVFSFVGVGGNWDISNTDYVFTEYHPFEMEGGYRSFKKTMTFSDNETFKIICNHDWAQGEFNFSHIDFFDPSGENEKLNANFQPESEYQNIKVLEGGTYEVTIKFALSEDIDMDEIFSPISVKFTLASSN